MVLVVMLATQEVAGQCSGSRKSAQTYIPRPLLSQLKTQSQRLTRRPFRFHFSLITTTTWFNFETPSPPPPSPSPLVASVHHTITAAKLSVLLLLTSLSFSLCRTSKLLPSQCVGQKASISLRVRQLWVVSDAPLNTHHRDVCCVGNNDTMLSVLAQHGFIDVLSQLFYAMCKMSRSSIILQYDNIRVCMVCM